MCIGYFLNINQHFKQLGWSRLSLKPWMNSDSFGLKSELYMVVLNVREESF